ncbi:MAG TPA: Asp-tRNA(Asn)/Glu-tRNA(Gln) amidotransferase GatCAB subunit A, partial [Ruminococcus sp.]|nr:Asp-tRNA(Asn)/Glu-tRNA(Gln) amidotransferase GatCAB subunit A [Ruminococcus sp.]
MDIFSMTALETGKAIREGKLTAVEATKQVLDSAEAKNDKINAYITICREKALAQV